MVPRPVHDAIVSACLEHYPLEACGLLGGRFYEAPSEHGEPDGIPGFSATASTVVHASYDAVNEAHSSRIYTVAPRDLLRADRAAEAAGISLVGVWHSHTHTDAYPSPTDVAQAPDPSWHYVVVSLRDTEPAMRSYRIRNGQPEEEPIAVQ